MTKPPEACCDRCMYHSAQGRCRCELSPNFGKLMPAGDVCAFVDPVLFIEPHTSEPL